MSAENFIFDNDGNPLTAVSLQFEPNEVKVLPVVILCLGNYSLWADVVANFTVEGRKTVGGIYVNLETTPIDLTADDGLYVPFQIKITAGSTAAHRQFNLRVSRL